MIHIYLLQCKTLHMLWILTFNNSNTPSIFCHPQPFKRRTWQLHRLTLLPSTMSISLVQHLILRLIQTAIKFNMFWINNWTRSSNNLMIMMFLMIMMIMMYPLRIIYNKLENCEESSRSSFDPYECASSSSFPSAADHHHQQSPTNSPNNNHVKVF